MEAWENQTKIRNMQESNRKRAKRGLEQELEALITAGIGATTWEEREMPPKKLWSNSPTPPLEKWDCDIEEEEEEDWRRASPYR